MRKGGSRKIKSRKIKSRKIKTKKGKTRNNPRIKIIGGGPKHDPGNDPQISNELRAYMKTIGSVVSVPKTEIKGITWKNNQNMPLTTVQEVEKYKQRPYPDPKPPEWKISRARE